MTLALVEPAPEMWDAFVRSHPQGHLLQLSAWGTLKSSVSGWQVQRLAVAEGNEEGNPSSFPLVAGAQMLFRTRYAISVAYVPRGPLFSGSTMVDDMLLAALQRAARRRRAVFLRFEPNMLETAPRAHETHASLLRLGFRTARPIQPHSTIHLDLAPPPETLFASFRKGHRADIRRAERLGVQVRVGNARDIPTFYAILEATGKRGAFAIHPEEYYQQAWSLFHERSCLLLAEHDSRPLAGHMVFADARAGLYLYSGAVEAGLTNGSNHLLQWHAIQWARAQHSGCYDLWGVPDALGRAAAATDENQRAALEQEAQRDPLIGVYRFKKGFGGRIVRYLPAYDQVYLAPLYALWRRRLG